MGSVGLGHMGRFALAILIRGLSSEPRAFVVYCSVATLGYGFSAGRGLIDILKQELC